MRYGRVIFILALALLASCGQATTSTEATPEQSAAAGAQTPPIDATVFCAEVARRVTAAQCDTYVQLARSAERGVAAFNAPNPMRRGEMRTLQLAISAPTPIESETTTTASQTPSDVVSQLPGETVEFKPLVGRFMRAELTGAGFDITSRSPTQQEVMTDSVTTWTWQVVARQGGNRSLTLTTVVVGCADNGECVPLRSTTQNYTVDVSVAALDQARDFLTGLPDWIKIASAILAALAGLLTAIAALRGAARRNRSA